MRAGSLPVSVDTLEPRASHASRWRQLGREPLLHFVLLGALIFVAAHIVEEKRRSSQVQVVVDSGLRQRLANLHRAQFGVAPTATQLDTLVEGYVDDEVLYREAIRLGLDQDDEIIRRRLIQKLEFLQRDAGTRTEAQAEVSDQELRNYYDAHREQFAAPARASFTHVYFNPDRAGAADAFARATRARAELLATGNAPAADAFPLDSSYDSMSPNDAKQLFGAAPFVDALFGQVTGSWSQPVRSGFGWHLIKVKQLIPARVAPYDEVAPDVRAAYFQEANARARKKQLNTLRARYHVTYDSSSIAGDPR
jgi:peptidyl-prolyl cis-trans isomerase C